ncbi:MAG: hypothetical protein JXR14_00855 [Paracoccaceae bacterium]
MKAYLAQLKDLEQEDAERRTTLQAEKNKQARERLSPLEDRLERLLATIPADVQHEGLSLASLQTSLKGRWRGSCHPGELGGALRKLGYVRKRQWAGGSSFRTLWFSVRPEQ